MTPAFPRQRAAIGERHPVDEMLPAARLIGLGAQNVLVMYANAVAVPMIVGAALHLSRAQLAILITCDLFVCGLTTILQAAGWWRLGIRLPIIMGVTAVAISPLAAIAAMPGMGAPGLFGSVIAAGLVALCMAPFVRHFLGFFPPVVTGSIITMIGVSLLRIGVNWAGGGADAPDFGAPAHLGLAAFVLGVTLLILRLGRGLIANSAVMIGLAAGYMLSIMLGQVDLSGVGQQPWVAVVQPFYFGAPTFHLIPIATMVVVMTIVFIEATGMFLALGSMTGREVGPDDITRGLLADATATIIGGVFNTFPFVSYSQNIGLVGVTGIVSRWVCVTAGVIMIWLGLLPKLAYIVASVPKAALGGASFLLFGMVAASGIRMLASVDYAASRANSLIVAISIGFGLIPICAPQFFQAMPASLHPVFNDGIILTSFAALLMNAAFNDLRPTKRFGEQG